MSDTLTARALLAQTAQQQQIAEHNARRFRELLASVCKVNGPVAVHILKTRVWAEVDGHVLTLIEHGSFGSGLGLVVCPPDLDSAASFSDLAHLAELLSATVDARLRNSQPPRPWWKIW